MSNTKVAGNGTEVKPKPCGCGSGCLACNYTGSSFSRERVRDFAPEMLEALKGVVAYLHARGTVAVGDLASGTGIDSRELGNLIAKAGGRS